MSPRRRLAGLCLPLALVATSCGLGYDEGEYLWIRREGADMPVMVRGNLDSGVFVIFNHGGPGSSAIFQASERFFAELERDYAVVLWDQRASGLAQGDARAESFTLDNFVADADLLVQLDATTVDQRERFSAAMGPMTFGFDEFVAMRLN